MHVWVNESYVLFDLFFKNKSSLYILCLLKENDFTEFLFFFFFNKNLFEPNWCMLETKITSALQSSYLSILFTINRKWL